MGSTRLQELLCVLKTIKIIVKLDLHTIKYLIDPYLFTMS